VGETRKRKMMWRTMACLGPRGKHLLGAVAASGLLVLALPDALMGQQADLLSESRKALYQNEFARSATLASRFLKTHPADSKGLVLLARAEMAQGKLEAAYRTFLRALRANPKDIDALYYLGRLCRALAVSYFEKLYTTAPDSARVHQFFAEADWLRQDLGKAEEEYKAALRNDPQLVEVLNALGELKQRQYKFAEAIDYYSRAAAVRPRDYDSAYGLGSCFLYLQQPDQALEHLKRAISIDPSSSPARLALGDAYLRMGRAQDAVAELKAAVGLNPSMRQAYVLLARSYNKLGQSQEARAALAKAQELLQKEKLRREKLLESWVISAEPGPSAGAKEEGKE